MPRRPSVRRAGRGPERELWSRRRTGCRRGRGGGLRGGRARRSGEGGGAGGGRRVVPRAGWGRPRPMRGRSGWGGRGADAVALASAGGGAGRGVGQRGARRGTESAAATSRVPARRSSAPRAGGGGGHRCLPAVRDVMPERRKTRSLGLRPRNPRRGGRAARACPGIPTCRDVTSRPRLRDSAGIRPASPTGACGCRPKATARLYPWGSSRRRPAWPGSPDRAALTALPRTVVGVPGLTSPDAATIGPVGSRPHRSGWRGASASRSSPVARATENRWRRSTAGPPVVRTGVGRRRGGRCCGKLSPMPARRLARARCRGRESGAIAGWNSIRSLSVVVARGGSAWCDGGQLVLEVGTRGRLGAVRAGR